MLPEERAQEAYQKWIAQVSEEVRQLVDGTPYQRLFVEVVAATIADAQETVTLGAATAELPHGRHL
jgi:hypothetical protein